MDEDPDKTAFAATSTETSSDNSSRLGAGSRGENPGQCDQSESEAPDRETSKENLDNFNGEMVALDFEIAKSIRYHSKRCGFFEGLNHWTRGASAIFAAGAIISIVGNSGATATVINAILAIALAADLVLDYSRRARTHDDLRREFAELLAEMEEHPPETPGELRRFSAKRRKIEVQEPPTIEVLNVICANEELEGRGYPYRYRVTPMQYLLRNFFSWRAHEFPQIPAPAAIR